MNGYNGVLNKQEEFVETCFTQNVTAVDDSISYYVINRSSTAFKY